MRKTISIDFCLNCLSNLPIIDVRSPGEYSKGHIPKAISVPLFSDEERAIIGTAYKQGSKEKAIELGYKFVNPKLDSFIKKTLKIAPNKAVVVHCWRGGMRSNAFATYIEEQGFEKVYIIEGGYKAFRNYVLNFLENPFRLNVLGGYTGSGKTEILHCLSDKGQQIVDLEGLASHRGSAFGGIDLPEQPSSEQFENNLFTTIQLLDREKPIWVEDESNAIGRVNIPKQFFTQMRDQKLYFLNISQAERAKHLVDTYSNLNADGLAESIIKITKRLGYNKGKLALEELEKKNYLSVVEIILFYYDKYYKKGLKKRQTSNIVELNVDSTNHEKNADFLISTSKI